MKTEASAQLYQGVEPHEYRAPILRLVEINKQPSELESLITHFDQNWEAEWLPQDWYNFGKAGFSMRSQMRLLPDLEFESIQLWLARTEQDVRGFTVEYLQQDLVHPAFYRKERGEDGKLVLVDEKYGKPLVQMVDPREREGAVTEALENIQEAIDSGRKAAIMTSPRGWTSLSTDRDIPIEYPDSWLFNFVDVGERVVGFGVKTDFSLSECRQAIAKLTGEDLSADASVGDYVRAIAKISPDQGVNSPQDLVRVLRQVRPSPYIYEDRTWDEVYERAGRLEELYGLEVKAEGYIREFRNFATENEHTKLELQKALAATLLRLSKLYLERGKEAPNVEKYKILGGVIYPERFQRYVREELIYGATYGQVLNEVEKIPGCAGGGNKDSLSVTSIAERLGIGSQFSDDGLGTHDVYCKKCRTISKRPFGKLLDRCSNMDCPDPTYIACKPSKTKAA